MKAIIIIIVLVLTAASVYSYDNSKPAIHKDADMTVIHTGNSDFHPNFVTHNYAPVMGQQYAFVLVPLGVYTVYDIQSNAVPNEIWNDPLVPSNVHSVFMYSLDTVYVGRYCAYLFSNDGGSTWSNLGNVPSSGRAGFPSISGFTNGSSVIATMNTSNGTSARAKIDYDAGAGFGVFTEMDPGYSIGESTSWPRIIGIGNTKVLMAVQGNMTLCLNLTPTFSGWDPYPGSGAETYFISRAPNFTIGHTYIGLEGTDNENDLFYRYSTNDGLNWSVPEKIWNWNNIDSLGVLRGISMVFGSNNEPYVAFEVSRLGTSGIFFPGLPSSIRLWSPAINGGIPKIIADENNIPFHPNKGNVSDGFLPVCRPAIGRSLQYNGIFIAYNATTGQYGSDSSSYYAAWFSASYDNGISWDYPERMTPSNPLRDWRYISMSQTNKNFSWWPYILANVQMIIQDDSLPGAHVNGAPLSVAQAVAIITQSGFNNANSISNSVPEKYILNQNFPNPFNPSTSIHFDIPMQTNITLKVYNSGGQEVSVLINNEVVSSGTNEVTFDGSNLSSGIYFYTLFAGDYRETRKMMLLK